MLEQLIDKPYSSKMKFLADRNVIGDISLEEVLHVMSLAVYINVYYRLIKEVHTCSSLFSFKFNQNAYGLALE